MLTCPVITCSSDVTRAIHQCLTLMNGNKSTRNPLIAGVFLVHSLLCHLLGYYSLVVLQLHGSFSLLDFRLVSLIDCTAPAEPKAVM